LKYSRPGSRKILAQLARGAAITQVICYGLIRWDGLVRFLGVAAHGKNSRRQD
jgi:hypothetical protein